MRRAVMIAGVLLACASGGALALSCSFSHQDFPGECASGMDCFKGIETCDLALHKCVPLVDAAPLPDVRPLPDAGPDAGADAGADAGPDAAPDAAIDAGGPDA